MKTPVIDVPARSESYFILYYAEQLRGGGMGPIRRARFASVAEAVDKAHEMRHSPRFSPIEVRDPKDNLITCALMGWRVPALHRQLTPLVRRAG